MDEGKEGPRRFEECASARDLAALDRLVGERWRSHAEQHDSDRRVVEATRIQMETRLNAMNEFRDSLNDIVNKAVPRDMYDQRHSELDRRIQTIERDMVRQGALDAANQELARTRKALAYTIIGGVTVTLVAAVVDVVIRASAH